MKAAVLTELKKPLEIQEVPDPSPGPNDAIVRVEGCGICRSDWHIWQGDWTWIGIEPELPFIMGHEFGGVVEAIGANVRNFKEGDHVTVPFTMACGCCNDCYSGHSNICLEHGIVGIHYNGAYARYALIPDANVNLAKLPEGIDFMSAAALGCRYMTSYHGLLDRAEIKPGEWLAVYGIGGIGSSAVQIASAIGAQVIAVDIGDDKLEFAKNEGAVATINSNNTDPVEAIKEISKGGVNVSMDALGLAAANLASINSLRKGGRHLQIGLTGHEEKGIHAIPSDAMVVNELSYIASLGCPISSYGRLLTLVASGKLQPGRLVTKQLSIKGASDVLASMTGYSTLGFQVISNW